MGFAVKSISSAWSTYTVEFFSRNNKHEEIEIPGISFVFVVYTKKFDCNGINLCLLNSYRRWWYDHYRFWYPFENHQYRKLYPLAKNLPLHVPSILFVQKYDFFPITCFNRVVSIMLTSPRIKRVLCCLTHTATKYNLFLKQKNSVFVSAMRLCSGGRQPHFWGFGSSGFATSMLCLSINTIFRIILNRF